ncbi:short chain dehydrogenase [Actinophytocola xinjiangensis]|uniref:Short chain dehydrogenase n=1 Tax=Actinophytocola xinjiangensis TaxID=485602 RepID=A0A7Z0WI03_9PSEU|nr:SDR family oxidoreductase [Actinophytocola xinjiangensis]OLF07698.1 short chain dehydrogenase [Actinophytocola xinjiangensis]
MTVVLVTGGSRGVGRGIVEAFAATGATVVSCGRTPSDLPGHRVADVRDPSQVDDLVAAVLADHGRLDVLVNNAGGAPPADAATVSPRFHAKIIELNLVAPLHVSQRANVVMQSQDTGGTIVMIGSVAGARPSPTYAAYGAAKAGLANLAASLAVEWAPKVRVNTLVVGPVGTDDAPGIPLGRPATPADVASACLYLASPAAAYVSGAALAVHGGAP